jgi:hypothetical protein
MFAEDEQILQERTAGTDGTKNNGKMLHVLTVHMPTLFWPSAFCQ